MKKIAIGLSLALGATLLTACGPYPPGDCRYDHTCRDYPYNENNRDYPGRDYAPAGGYQNDSYYDSQGRRFYLSSDGYYYADPSFRGDRYSRDGERYYYAQPPVPPGGYYRPTQPENHPDKF